MLIEPLSAPLAAADRAALDELLRDAVASGGSVGYVEVPSADEAREYWRGVEAALGAGMLMLFAGRFDDRLVGSVQIALDARPNSGHRGELKRLLVHTATRNRGLGTALMLAAEREARRAGLSLLILDVIADAPAERLYRALGWHSAGKVPDYAMLPDGSLGTTLFMYRRLGA